MWRKNVGGLFLALGLLGLAADLGLLQAAEVVFPNQSLIVGAANMNGSRRNSYSLANGTRGLTLAEVQGGVSLASARAGLIYSNLSRTTKRIECTSFANNQHFASAEAQVHTSTMRNGGVTFIPVTIRATPGDRPGQRVWVTFRARVIAEKRVNGSTSLNAPSLGHSAWHVNVNGTPLLMGNHASTGSIQRSQTWTVPATVGSTLQLGIVCRSYATRQHGTTHRSASKADLLLEISIQ